MPKFRKKPVTIEAHRITRSMRIKTLESGPDDYQNGEPGDWLITGVKGEQYFCKDDIFRMTYEPATEDARVAFLRKSPVQEKK